MSFKSVIVKIGYVALAFCAALVPAILALSASLIFINNNLIASLIGNLASAVIFTSLYAIYRFKNKDAAFQIHSKFNVKTVLALFGVCAVLAFMLNTIFYWISVHVSNVGLEPRAESYESRGLLMSIIFSVAVAPVCEEIIYRLFIYNFLKRKMSWLTAMIISSLLFGMAHMTGPHVVVGTVFGMFMCMCYELSGSCLTSIGLHITYNLLSLVIPSNRLGSSTVLTWFFIVMVLGIFTIEMFAVEGLIGKPRQKRISKKHK